MPVYRFVKSNPSQFGYYLLVVGQLRPSELDRRCVGQRQLAMFRIDRRLWDESSIHHDQSLAERLMIASSEARGKMEDASLARVEYASDSETRGQCKIVSTYSRSTLRVGGRSDDFLCLRRLLDISVAYSIRCGRSGGDDVASHSQILGGRVFDLSHFFNSRVSLLSSLLAKKTTTPMIVQHLGVRRCTHVRQCLDKSTRRRRVATKKASRAVAVKYGD